MDMREGITAVVADVNSGADPVAGVERGELGFGLNWVIHGHRFHEILNGSSIDGGGLFFGVNGDDFTGERVMFLCSRLG